MIVRAYEKKDLESMIQIWNEVVEEGVAFPQEEFLDEITGIEFFASQTYCGVAEDENNHTVHGLYILHPNNIGRCGHICNASYAVSSKSRVEISFVLFSCRNSYNKPTDMQDRQYNGSKSFFG